MDRTKEEVGENETGYCYLNFLSVIQVANRILMSAVFFPHVFFLDLKQFGCGSISGRDERRATSCTFTLNGVNSLSAHNEDRRHLSVTSGMPADTDECTAFEFGAAFAWIN
jgi:hypothetical protein